MNNVYLPSVLIANVRSLSGKVDELSVIANINDIDIICITETWLTDTIPDSTVSLQNFNMFRNDRTSSVGGGVCAYINSKIKVRRIYDFENSFIESLWMSVRPNRLPRSIPVLLLAVIYHSTSRDATENCKLYNHIQGNVDLFLLNHPDALVMICGDFNPVSTGFNANRIKQILRTRKSDKAWVTQSLKLLIKRRQRALHLYGKISQIYKYWRNKVQQEVKTARKRFYHQSVKKLKNTNPARWWKEIKSLGGLSSQQSWHHQLLSDDNPNCADLAESYNDFLVGLTAHFEPLARCHQIEETEVPDYVMVNPGQVYSALRRIKTTKSQGPDGIPNKVLKTFAFELAPVLSDIYNSSMLQGTFPEKLKRSFVVPIPKVSPPNSI